MHILLAVPAHVPCLPEAALMVAAQQRLSVISCRHPHRLQLAVCSPPTDANQTTSTGSI